MLNTIVVMIQLYSVILLINLAAHHIINNNGHNINWQGKLNNLNYEVSVYCQYGIKFNLRIQKIQHLTTEKQFIFCSTIKSVDFKTVSSLQSFSSASNIKYFCSDFVLAPLSDGKH